MEDVLSELKTIPNRKKIERNPQSLDDSRKIKDKKPVIFLDKTIDTKSRKDRLEQLYTKTIDFKILHKLENERLRDWERETLEKRQRQKQKAAKVYDDHTTTHTMNTEYSTATKFAHDLHDYPDHKLMEVDPSLDYHESKFLLNIKLDYFINSNLAKKMQYIAVKDKDQLTEELESEEFFD